MNASAGTTNFLADKSSLPLNFYLAVFLAGAFQSCLKTFFNRAFDKITSSVSVKSVPFPAAVTFAAEGALIVTSKAG